MLSSVLKSERAAKMGIYIVRVFVRLREVLSANKNLAREFDQLRHQQQRHAQLRPGRHDDRTIPTNRFARRVPVQPFGTCVPGEDGVIQGHAEDGVVRRVDNGCQTSAGLVRQLAAP